MTIKTSACICQFRYVKSWLQEVARELRPNSLRARFGEDTVRNALHCSDLPDDGPLEVSTDILNSLLCLVGYSRIGMASILSTVDQLIAYWYMIDLEGSSWFSTFS